MSWKIIKSTEALPQIHMDTDAHLLKNASVPLIHHYDWKGMAATHGCFVDPFTLLSRQAVVERNLFLGKRPTGGGIIFHLTDLAFSIVVPAAHSAYSCNTMENYAFVNKIVIKALSQFLGGKQASLLPEEPQPLDAASKHFCMAKPTRYDVVVGGKKIGGAAQRRTKHGFLHQGTISIAKPPQDLLAKVLLPGSRVQEAMEANTYALIDGVISENELKEVRETIRHLLNEQVMQLPIQESNVLPRIRSQFGVLSTKDSS